MNYNNNNKQDVRNKYKVRPKNPKTLITNIFSGFKKRNAYKSPRFWITTAVFIFLSIKCVQLSLYVREFTVMIPKEEAYNNMLKYDKNTLKNMKSQILNEYLDNLEKLKHERQNKKKD